jgi:hypothetical protein
MSSARLIRGRLPFEEAAPEPSLRERQVIRASNNGEPAPPPVEQSLIDYLRKTYPVSVTLSHTLRDYDRMAGIQEVLDHLQTLHDEQQNPP